MVRAVEHSEIAESGWSLNPGRYVKAPVELVETGEFVQQRDALRAELRQLSASAIDIHKAIDRVIGTEVAT